MTDKTCHHGIPHGLTVALVVVLGLSSWNLQYDVWQARATKNYDVRQANKTHVRDDEAIGLVITRDVRQRVALCHQVNQLQGTVARLENDGEMPYTTWVFDGCKETLYRSIYG